MSKKVGNVEFYAGPVELGAPDDLETVIVGFIDQTQKKLEIAVQELENRPIAEAIVRAKKRKVTVKLVLEQDYLRAKVAAADPWTGGGENEVNREIFNAVLRTNIDVKADYNNDIFHQKFMVRDGESLLTGSANFTDTDTHRNLNHVVVIHDKTVAKIYSREFSEIQQGHFGDLNEGHDDVPTDVVVSNVPIRVLFAPDHNPEMEIMKQMMKARKRIDFAIFTFARSSGIDDTMIRLLSFGMPIRGAFDAGQGAQDWAAIPEIKAAGGELYRVPGTTNSPVRKLHHKLMVLDSQVVIAGSFNYTAPANKLNDENIIILGDLDSTVATQIAAQKKIGAFALAEIDRMITDHGKKI